MRILLENNRKPMTVVIRDFATDKLVKRLRKKSFYCEVEDITPGMKKVHIVSLFF